MKGQHSEKPGILIVSYEWPPRNSIAVHRPYAWAKTWAAQGYPIYIVTPRKQAFDEPLDLELPELNGVRVVEVPSISVLSAFSAGGSFLKLRQGILEVAKKVIRPLLNQIGKRVGIRDGWTNSGFGVASDLVAKEHIEIVVSTFGPRSCHVIASRLKSQYQNIFWIADYRDQWSENHMVGLSFFSKMSERKNELKTVDDANIISAVSRGQAEILKKLFLRDILVVMNGFDEDINVVSSRLMSPLKEKRAPIVIVYTGTIYPKFRDPSPLFVAIKELFNSGKIGADDVKVRFFGDIQPGLKEMIDENQVELFVDVCGHVSRGRAVEEQRRASLLLILENSADWDKGVLTGKVFEYMASGVPIINIGGLAKSELGALLVRAGVGICCENDLELIKNVILSFKEKGGAEWWRPDVDFVQSLNREAQSAIFLNKITHERARFLEDKNSSFIFKK